MSKFQYLLDFAFSSDMKSFVYFIDTKEMLKCGRGWNDQNNDEARDARLIVEQEVNLSLLDVTRNFLCSCFGTDINNNDTVKSD